MLYEEQGVGDSIQFIRYAKNLSEKGAHVIVECQPDLKALLATAPGVKAVFSPPQPMPGFDVHTPLLSLPYLCGADMDSLPAGRPLSIQRRGLGPAGTGRHQHWPGLGGES